MRCASPRSRLLPLSIAFVSIGRQKGREVHSGRAHVILLNLVEQGSIANLQEPRRCFAVPTSLLERVGDRTSLRFSLNASHQGFEASRMLFRSAVVGLG